MNLVQFLMRCLGLPDRPKARDLGGVSGGSGGDRKFDRAHGRESKLDRGLPFISSQSRRRIGVRAPGGSGATPVASLQRSETRCALRLFADPLPSSSPRWASSRQAVAPTRPPRLRAAGTMGEVQARAGGMRRPARAGLVMRARAPAGATMPVRARAGWMAARAPVGRVTRVRVGTMGVRAVAMLAPSLALAQSRRPTARSRRRARRRATP